MVENKNEPMPEQYSKLIDDLHGRIAELELLVDAAPNWMERPSGPGCWICMVTVPGSSLANGTLTQESVDAVAPFYTSRVYGPITCPRTKSDP